MAILTGEGTTFTIATDDEAFSGADVNKAITPDQLLAVVSQSVAAVSGGLIYKGVFNATTLKPDLSNARQGDFYKVSVADTAYGETYAVGDMLLINADMGGTIDANKIDKIDNSEALTSLDDLTDVTLVNSNTGEVLRYNGTDWVNQEISADDLNADHTGVNYTAANTDSITTHLAGIDTALASAGASDLNGLTDVTITGAATGEVLRYSGAQWVDAQLSYNDLSNTPTLPSSSDDLTSDHTGTNYTGANTDTVTTHLSGIDSELNNRADTVNSVAVANGAVTIDGDDIIAPRTGTNYTAANTDSITTHLAGIDTALASAGASDLNGLTDVTITGAATGEVLRYSGAQWVDAQLSYNDLSNTPTLPSSSDDLTSDHTGTNYTGANTDTVTTHLSGIDSELNNRADTVNSVAVANGAVTIDGDDIIAPRIGTNYTAANTDSITTHLAGIDTALASAGGGGATLTVLSNTTYTLSASNAAGIHIWYGAANNSTFTVTMPDIANVISTAASVNGVPVETFEVYVGRAQAGDITISAADGIDLLGDGSVSYSTTQTVNAGQWVKLIGWYVSGTTQRYIMDSAAQPRDAALDSISGLTTAANQLIYTTASDTYAVASLTAAGRALLDDADATAQRATLNLGSAATLNAGTGANELVQLDASSRLPAVDGSQLINLPASTSDLNGLSDVTITTAATGEILRYNGTNWVDAPLSISDDPSPSLGGDLNLNGNGISSHLVPSTTGKDIGTSSAEWRNLYLADNSKILFGLDQDVELIHNPDDGLILDLGVADGSHDPQLELKSQTSGLYGARLTFTTESTTPASFDRVGQMRFQGKDSAGNLQDYGYIYGQIHDPTSGAEAGKISILAYPASANTRGLHVEGIAGDASGAKVNIDHNGSSYGLHLNNTLVTSTANELNLLDGGTAVGSSITIADTDGVIVNDGGTSKLVPASDLKTYIGASSGGGFTYSSISSTTTAQAQYHYSCDTSTAGFTLTLPAASGVTAGQEVRVKNMGSNTVTVSRTGTTDTIDGQNSITMAVQYQALSFISNGSNGWEII